MQFAILRHAKIKAPLMGAAVAHNYRTSKLEKCNIDPALTPLNLALKLDGTPHERLADRLKTVATKVRKDAVVTIEMVLSMTPEWFDGLTEDRHALRKHPKFIEWANASIAWARKEFGHNVIDVALHMDESSPHLHVLAVPLTQDGRLCAKEILARAELMRRQTSYAKAMEPFGVNRGIPAAETKRRHIKLKDKPDGGGKASELAAQLAAANKKIDQQTQLIQRLQGFCTEYMAEQAAMKKELAEVKKTLEMERMVATEMAASKQAAQELRENAENDPETAMALFLDQHKELHWCSPQEAAVGTLVASEGPFAVLHLGRGRHVLYEFDSVEQVQELARGKQRDRGHDFDR